MKTLYPLHSLVRRNMALVEHFIAAAGLSLLLYGLMRAVPVYPLYWDGVVAGAIFVLTLISPVAGYFAAVLAALYPLYSVSLYLAVLFLAIAVIGQHGFINNLGATLLTFSSPILGSIYLAWGIPLLGGLWWGPAGGALMGAFAALWGLLVAGMAGLTPDWVNLYGVLPILAYLPDRFAQADSLQAIYLLFLPLMPDSTSLLYCLLQIASWSFIGWAVGMFGEKEWVIYNRPRASFIIILVGSSVLALIHILLGVWLGRSVSSNAGFALGMTTLFSALVAMLLEWGEDFFEHPLPVSGEEQSARAIQLEAAVTPAPNPNHTPAQVESSEPAKVQESRKRDDEDDLIMLELD